MTPPPAGITDAALDVALDPERRASLRRAAIDDSPVAGSTHSFYRYPARFSPGFVASAIEAYSKPGDLVLDPFMGGGTTLIEAAQLGRSAIGNDINALAVFIARVKTTRLTNSQIAALTDWANFVVPSLRYQSELADRSMVLCSKRTRNLTLPHARPIKKITALALTTLEELPDGATRRFARCALLNVGQWALNGRRRPVTCASFRAALQDCVHRMLAGIEEYALRVAAAGGRAPSICMGSATEIAGAVPFRSGAKADLVVMSPPYPGIHILYHRWQVDGRKESPAPYWISGTMDGKGGAHYNLGDRKKADANDYFEMLEVAMRAIRTVTKDGAKVIQMVAFGRPARDLPRYLTAMLAAGFGELHGTSTSGTQGRRLWRSVPGRAWHATSKGDLPASREVVLIHKAI